MPAARSGLVDSAVYRNGVRVASTKSLGETFRLLREHEGGMAWIGLYRPDATELNSLAEEFELMVLDLEVTSLFERDRRLLEFLDGNGIQPGTKLNVRSASSDLEVTADNRPIRLDRSVAAKVWVKTL